jgi:hypothetical protein
MTVEGERRTVKRQSYLIGDGEERARSITT